jgi:glyoxylase-like metal-dependent hydrolase (beta-lactamase superfamily II)
MQNGGFCIHHSAFIIGHRILTVSFRVGSLQCHLIVAGTLRLDGGAMFGVVPKPLWERRTTPDERNRIPLAMRCLLVEHDDGLVLVDTGLGDKDDAKFRDIYGADNVGTRGRTWLEDGLAGIGYGADDIRWVINTHLHFDHAGGDTYRTPAGELLPSFPRARYVVQRGELDFARHTNERTAGSYVAANFSGIDFLLLEGESTPLPGIRCLPTPGHVPYHQSILVESGGEVACFIADLIPTSAHIPLPWIMGYDVEPLVTLETRRRVYQRAEADGWRICFEHDPTVAMGRLGRDGKGFGLVEPVPAT